MGSKPRSSALWRSAEPRTADLCREQIELGLDNHPKHAQKALNTLRNLLPKDVRLTPDDDGGLWAD